MKTYFLYGTGEFPDYKFECIEVIADTMDHAKEVFKKKYGHKDIAILYTYYEKEYHERFLRYTTSLELAPEIKETLYQYSITNDEEITLRSLLKHGWNALARDGIGRLFAYNSRNATCDWRNPTMILFDKRVQVYQTADYLSFIGNDEGMFKIKNILENSKVVEFDATNN